MARLSTLLLVVLFVTFAAAVRFVVLYARRRAADARYEILHRCEEIPKLQSGWPLGIDLILGAVEFARSGRILGYFIQVVEEYGPTFEQNLLLSRGVNTIDPVNIEAVLSSDFQAYGLGDRRKIFLPLLGDGIFTQDGPAWKHSRALLRPYFSNKRTNLFDEVKRQTQILVDNIPENQAVDLQPLFFRLTLDTTTFLLFGIAMNTLQGQNSEEQAAESRFAEAFRVSQDIVAQRMRLGPMYWLVGGRSFYKACKVVHEFIDSAIDAAVKSCDEKAGDVVSEDEAAFVEVLLQSTRDRRVLRDQCINTLLAGRDTTACLLSWTFRLLAMHPRVMQKLREEVANVLGSGHREKEPDRSDIKKMTYLSDVLREVLRLYPSVPVNGRLAEQTTSLPRGGGEDGRARVIVHKGEPVGYCIYVMHRSKDLYGPDADEFRPERWASDLKEYNLKDIGWGYLPFNGGPRICLGQEFALLEAAFVTVRMLQTFSDISVPPDQPLEPLGEEIQQLTLVLAPQEGCVLQLRR